jgi:hypothetical protein
MEFNPRDLIDRTAEQEQFHTLVAFESEARILTICDGGGRGKSSLLRRLRYNCQHEINPPVPSCLLELDRLLDPSPFAFASAVAQGFSVRGENIRARFGKFNHLDGARTSKDFTPFDDGSIALPIRSPHAVGTATTGQVYPGGTAIGFQVEHAEFHASEFTEDQEQRARERCVDALFDDIRAICANQPMVVLLDGWEGCNLPLREWIFNEMIGNHVLHPDKNLRPRKLAVVIAGRPHGPGINRHGLRSDEFRPLFDSDEDFSATVLSKESLSKWDPEHVSDFLVLNGCPEPSESEVNIILEQLSRGRSLEKILTLIDEHFRR